MNQIYETNDSFQFENLTLIPPTVISGGNHFIKFAIKGVSLYIQPPKCMIKGAISKTNKRSHCDLMFSNQDMDFIKWMEDLETYACKKIFENKVKWFESDMELSDVENYLASPLKIYKSGKNYLARANIPTRLGKINLKIYNENEEEIDPETITDNTNVISILEVQGIKCSARSFQIEFEVKQMLTLSPVNLFDKCILVNKSVSEPVKTNTLDKNTTTTVVIPKIEEMIDTKIQQEIIESPKLVDKTGSDDLIEFELDIHLEDIPYDEHMKIKPRNDVYYELYKEARKKARISRNMAIQSYLEAKEIQTKYDLDDIESDEEDPFYENILHSETPQ